MTKKILFLTKITPNLHVNLHNVYWHIEKYLVASRYAKRSPRLGRTLWGSGTEFGCLYFNIVDSEHENRTESANFKDFGTIYSPEINFRKIGYAGALHTT